MYKSFGCWLYRMSVRCFISEHFKLGGILFKIALKMYKPFWT